MRSFLATLHHTLWSDWDGKSVGDSIEQVIPLGSDLVGFPILIELDFLSRYLNHRLLIVRRLQPVQP